MEWAERLIALAAFALAMWQFLLIDRSLIGFAMVWLAPPVVMTALLWFRANPSRAFRHIATVYLALVSAGSWIAPSHSLFPNLNANHPGATDFAERWNRLDLTSRRLIAWNMGASSLFMFFGLGYGLFYTRLRRWRLYGDADISRPTCLLGLLVLWGITLLAALVILIVLVGA